MLRYRLLGRSGLKVAEIGLGTMTFGETRGWGADRAAVRAMLDAYAAAGGNLVDTANRYAEGASESLLGELLAPDRERWVLATKYSLVMRRDEPNAAGNSRRNLVRSLEASLKRLRTDWVDVLWVHAWDYLTPVEEVLRGLDDVVRAGKVLYVGISDTPAWIVSRANAIAGLSGWTPFVALQVEYSLAQRAAERELLPMARALDLAVTAWGPLAGGALTGKYNPGGAAAATSEEPARYAANPTVSRRGERVLAIADVVREVAREAGWTPAQVALAWLLRRPGNVIPIVGARRREQLEDCLGGAGRALDPAHAARLEEASRIELSFPHDFLAGDTVRDLVYGGFQDRIDQPATPRS